MQRPSRITATAPIRICDNGGWTDTWVARHGKVFNIAVQPLVEVRVDVFPHGERDAHIVLNVENFETRYAPSFGQTGWGPHPLLEAALQAIPPPSDVAIEVTIRSMAPPGASTGTSAAVVVALLGALDHLDEGRRTRSAIATAAHAVETVRLGRQSGVQDQFCAAFGGVNFIEITDYPQAEVFRIELTQTTWAELDRRLALIYLGRPHSSSIVHERVMGDLQRLGPDCLPLNRLRDAAVAARDAALIGDFDALGRAMRDNTMAQAELHADLVQPEAWRVIEIAGAHGAVGWKVNGAGGDGGSITLLCDAREAAKSAMLAAIEQENPAFRSISISLNRAGLSVS